MKTLLGIFMILLALIVLNSCGPKGDRGDVGPQGPQGPSCTVSTVLPSVSVPNGGALMVCPDTSQALIHNGTDGAPGTSVSMIKFCTGYTTTYPSSFPEYGTCVGGQLYGVYWDRTNAWEALVAPGYYSSTSTSAPCNFSVGANCTIY